MNLLNWPDESLSLRILQTLFHFLWQGTAIGALAFTVDWIGRQGSAQGKYILHVLALLGMITCLPVTFSLTDSPPPDNPDTAVAQVDARPEGALFSPFSGLTPNVRPELAQKRIADVTTPANPAKFTERTRSSPDYVTVENVEGQNAAPRTETAESGFPYRESLLPVVAPYVTATYFACVSFLLMRLVAGVWGGQKLRSFSVSADDPAFLATIARQANLVGLRTAPAVAFCERVSVPVVIGVFRPTILLPASVMTGLAPDQLEAIITHEMAHLRRYDPLVYLLQRFVEAVIFFHPAVWYVSRRIHVERENASDDLVVAAGWQRVHYADSLVRMAEVSFLIQKSPLASRLAMLAATGHRDSDLRRRVMRLLDGGGRSVRLTHTGSAAIMLIIAVAVSAPFTLQLRAQHSPAVENQDENTSIDDDSHLGRQIADFRLSDYLGAEYSLSDFADDDVVVIAFLGTQCPLAKLYGPRLESLAQKYKPQGVAFIGINSNVQDTPTEISHYVRQHNITFPILKDPGNRVADEFHAERTPEVFVLDAYRRVRYWGRIDDQFGVGYSRPEPGEHYVARAIDELLAGQSVSSPENEPVGCYIGRISKTRPTGNISYARQISRIVQRRCFECHREGGIAPFALDSYDAVAAWAETICEVVEDERMPPWHASPKFGHFANDGRMPDAEKEMLYEWVENGVPEGAAEELPAERKFVDGWALGNPDLILRMPEPITVPSNGVVDYQYVTIDPGLTESKWVWASEVRPGVRSVVHHIIVFIDPPGGDPILEERGVGFETVGGYVPGSPPMELRDGVARCVPAGSKFVFQIHYTPDGTEQKDQSEIGLYFTDPTTVRRTMHTGVAVNLDFQIPPHASNHRVEAVHRFSHDMEIHSIAPHMHYRGKSFRFEVTYPNGSREILLDVPRYDFNWQNVYRFATPRLMPEGTLLRCVAEFDNSEANPSNPDPTVDVRWGEQTWQEMMIGYFEGVFLNQDLSLPIPQLTLLGDGNYRAHFSYRPDRPTTTVNIAGTFNEWNTTSHPMSDPDGDGIYTADVVIVEGEHRYKFVIDGNYWTHDPASRILTGFFHESILVAGKESYPQSKE